MSSDLNDRWKTYFVRISSIQIKCSFYLMRMIDKQMLKTSSLNFNFVRSKILYEGSAWGSIIASRSRNENDPRTYKIGGDMRPVARSRCLTRPLAWQVKLTVRTSIKSHREKQREREREREEHSQHCGL